ncbi:hypothetical protein BKA56DRAFT_280493 [Ilyonectria sp. MPI-CAGE-AT-0026]|nr:hypothetical protein BKA56DRAFT_280493 [Ilyonectria sp. MPI-CAGE-AT-0026]
MSQPKENSSKSGTSSRILERIFFGMPNRKVRRFEKAENHSRVHHPPAVQRPPQVMVTGIDDTVEPPNDVPPNDVPPNDAPPNDAPAIHEFDHKGKSPAPVSQSDTNSSGIGTSSGDHPPFPPEEPPLSYDLAVRAAPVQLLPDVEKLRDDQGGTACSICGVIFGSRRGFHFFPEQKAHLPCGHIFGHQCIFWWLTWNRGRMGKCPRGGCITLRHECGHVAVPTTRPHERLFTDAARETIPWPCEFCESPRGAKLFQSIERSTEETRRARQGRKDFLGTPRTMVWNLREKFHWHRLFSKESKLEREAAAWFRRKWAKFENLCWRHEARVKEGMFMGEEFEDEPENQNEDTNAPSDRQVEKSRYTGNNGDDGDGGDNVRAGGSGDGAK